MSPGGFTDIAKATDLAAAGGIPLTSRTSGGQVHNARMEHIWVEAALDYSPTGEMVLT